MTVAVILRSLCALLVSLTPEMDAFQFYPAPDRNVIVIEPPVNLADPYNPIWGKTDTSMVLWQPSHSLTAVAIGTVHASQEPNFEGSKNRERDA